MFNSSWTKKPPLEGLSNRNTMQMRSNKVEPRLFKTRIAEVALRMTDGWPHRMARVCV